MISISSIDKLKEKIALEHPHWAESGIELRANEFVANCDPSLELIVEKYISEDIESAFTYGDYNIAKIRALNHNCGYLDAVMMLDGYIKDPVKGRAFILRR